MGICGSAKKTYAAAPAAAEEAKEAPKRIVQRRMSLVEVQQRYGENNEPALRVAAQGGNMAAIETLLRAGTSPNSRHKDGWSGLMWASMKGHVECVDLLLRSGADANLQEHEKGKTALMHAIEAGKIACVRALVEAGAELDLVSKTGDTALAIAKKLGKKDCVAALGGKVENMHMMHDEHHMQQQHMRQRVESADLETGDERFLGVTSKSSALDLKTLSALDPKECAAAEAEEG